MYRHCDGYPSGHGAELAEFLKPIKIVGGVGPVGTANGAWELAALMVVKFKNGQGHIYLTDRNDNDQSYEYVVRVLYDEITITCRRPKARKNLFHGSVEDFEAWCKNVHFR